MHRGILADQSKPGLNQHLKVKRTRCNLRSLASLFLLLRAGSGSHRWRSRFAVAPTRTLEMRASIPMLRKTLHNNILMWEGEEDVERFLQELDEMENREELDADMLSGRKPDSKKHFSVFEDDDTLTLCMDLQQYAGVGWWDQRPSSPMRRWEGSEHPDDSFWAVSEESPWTLVLEIKKNHGGRSSQLLADDRLDCLLEEATWDAKERVAAIEPAAKAVSGLAMDLSQAELDLHWSARDPISDKPFDEVDFGHMMSDTSRLDAYEKAIQHRLKDKEGWVVLDIGTGPFCLLAIMAANAGARRVYAIEGDPEVAEQARADLAMKEASGIVPVGVVKVIEGFSTDVTLPEKVDLLVTETFGSIASIEGCLTTILDAQKRHLKLPQDPASYIPQRVQTCCSPASRLDDSLKRITGWNPMPGLAGGFYNNEDVPPEEQWISLSDPQHLEDFELHRPFEYYLNDEYDEKNNRVLRYSSELDFIIDEEKINQARDTYYEDLTKICDSDNWRRQHGKRSISPERLMDLARGASQSCSGLACWIKLILDIDRNITIDTSEGNLDCSWRVSLNRLSERPLNVVGNESLSLTYKLATAKGVGIALDLEGWLRRHSHK